jgi:hypothetical protein
MAASVLHPVQVARVNGYNPNTHRSFCASGFMVGPRLFMTNRHVFPDADVARQSQIEFGYELDDSKMWKQTEVSTSSVCPTAPSSTGHGERQYLVMQPAVPRPAENAQYLSTNGIRGPLHPSNLFHPPLCVK